MKKYILPLILIFSLPTATYAQELTGTSYKARDGIICLGGPGTASTTYDVKNIIGANTGAIMCGLTYCISTGPTLEPEVVPGEGEFLVRNLGALSAPGGVTIFEATWQNDNDPYFYWEPPVEGVEVLGYSYALNEFPDDERDTRQASYYFPRDSIIDGAHTFYVKAQRLSGLWGGPAGFIIWVDTTAPTISNVFPGLGAVLVNDQPEVGAILFDAASGVNPATIEMRINRARAEPLFNPETGLVSYTPSVPLSEGENVVSLKAEDMVGNWSTPLVWSFTVDTKAPQGELLINNDDEMTTTHIVTLNILAEDKTSNIAQMIFSNDGIFDTETWEPFTTLRKNWALTAITGRRRVYGKVKDEAGNISEAFFDDIDLVIVAPNTYIVSGPAGVTQAQSAEFTYRGSLEDCQFSYKFDDEDWSDWSSATSANKGGLTEGNHYFIVRAAKDLNKDGILQLDEVDPTPAFRVWTVSFSGLLKPPAKPEKPIKLWEEE